MVVLLYQKRVIPTKIHEALSYNRGCIKIYKIVPFHFIVVHSDILSEEKKGSKVFMSKLQPPITRYQGSRRSRFSFLLLTGLLVPAMLTLVAAAVFVLPKMGSHAAATNGDCTLIVPTDPLSSRGLSTPYQLVATDAANGPCNEANATQAAFVQAAALDPVTGTIAVYDPLVIDQGTQPAAAPVAPTLPKGAIVGIWFGSNGNNLTLQGSGGSLKAGRCVNGANDSLFGQFAYCNAPNFFRAANEAILSGKLRVPALGRSKDGRTCPSVRDFSVVDMDQSDNVTTTYLVTTNGQTAQMTTANTNAFPNAHPLANGSDNRLLAQILDKSLGCTPWMAEDLANQGALATALPLNELQAAAHQHTPVALVPDNDPMVVTNNMPDITKLNAYRAGVDQPKASNTNSGNTVAYCTNLRMIAPRRLLADTRFTLASPSPDVAVANSLLTFLEQRYVTSYEENGLNCLGLLKQPDPITVTKDANGIVIDGSINGVKNGGQDQGDRSPNCVINGTVLMGCAGTTNINGQPCSFAFDAHTKQVQITCPASGNP